jgi:acyl carrier protein
MRWLPEIRETIADVLLVPPDTIQPATVSDDIPAWDSLTHLNLVVALEMQLGVRFKPDEIERMASVAAICDILAGKLGP